MPQGIPDPEEEVEAEALAQKVLAAYQEGSDSMVALVGGGELTPEQQAIAYKRLMKTGGFPPGTFEAPGYMDLIRSGEVNLQDSDRVKAGSGLRMLMSPEAHAVRMSMEPSPHVLSDPDKYLGGSPALQQQFGVQEGKKIISSQLKQIIKEELSFILNK